MDPNINQMLKTTFFPKLKKIARKYREIDTQRERVELIFELKVILETYKKYAAKLDKSGPPGKFEVRRAQLVVYIARSINIIATEFDDMKIKRILAEIKERGSKRARATRFFSGSENIDRAMLVIFRPARGRTGRYRDPPSKC